METEETQKPQRKIEYRIPADGLPHVYSNNVQMSSTSFDVRMLFGEVAEVAEDKVVVDHRVQVTMTWLEAKILADFLQANIKAYEDLNGLLKLPKNLDKLIVPETFVIPPKSSPIQ
jgi:hypothetical protein